MHWLMRCEASPLPCGLDCPSIYLRFYKNAKENAIINVFLIDVICLFQMKFEKSLDMKIKNNLPINFDFFILTFDGDNREVNLADGLRVALTMPASGFHFAEAKP